MKLYLVVVLRQNKIETVLAVTPNLTKAQQVLLGFLNELGKATLAVGVLADFSNEIITDNCAVQVNDEVTVQLETFSPDETPPRREPITRKEIEGIMSKEQVTKFGGTVTYES